MPNKEVIRKWVNALRSGEYEQGQGCLRDEYDRFCCLGVLCDIAEKSKVVDKPTLDCVGKYEYGAKKITGVLPFEVSSWASLSDPDPCLISQRDDFEPGGYASGLNDDGKTFSELADLIEQKYLKEESIEQNV